MTTEDVCCCGHAMHEGRVCGAAKTYCSPLKAESVTLPCRCDGHDPDDPTLEEDEVEQEELDPETKSNLARWHQLALVHGYNELVKLAETLGEKVYCRLARDHAEEEYKKLGGEITRQAEDEPVLVLTERMPYVRFETRDIELMRATVAKYDRERATRVRGLT